MGLGILEDKKLPHVPGTVILDDDAAYTEDTATAALKHGTGRNAHIVLNPQPSEDPNDPLNWPKWKKEMVIAVLCFGGMLNTATNGPFLNASYFSIAKQIDYSLTTVVLVSGYNLLIAGATGPFICAFSRKYGKRPVFLASTLFDIIGTALGEAKISYNYLLAARIIQGMSTSAFESLTVAAIGDMFFVHQRGSRVALINFILNTASSLASIICGVVYSHLGWKWLFHMFQIFLVVQFVIMFFCCPETTYIRDARYDLDTARDERFRELADVEEIYRHKHDKEGLERTDTTYTIPKKSFVQELAVFTGTYHHDWIFKDLFGPFLTLLNPAASYAVLCSGLLNAWYVGTAIIISGIFAGSPWQFGPAAVGYVGTGPFIGGLIASLITMFAGDPVIKILGRRNKGVYEPEFRLVFMALSAITCALGFFTFGWAMAHGKSAELCSFLWGVQMFGIIVGIWSTITYGLDAFRNLSSEMFIMNMLFKNFMFYALSNFANDWVEDKGPEQIMYVFGGTSVFLCALAVPVYVFGKRLRSWWSRHDLFVLLHMQKTGPVQELA
ncbi:serine/threonine kinase 16 [Myriangium duriaei CBS 260.36]|uniref:Serine/threonine kinase 16 n=1 Tax=Myriangium duriaei CBS 260.36 TaxID=1168546 RepID=A0A9P4MD74_9PEZI|nr:serine/threonine kinase 16 [Myriangium duriaei CBS 260.36]